MVKKTWDQITKDHVLQAIYKFDLENPEYTAPRTTFLVYNNKKYPAKHIRGMAYEIAYHRIISKDNYSGGKETVRFFRGLGFEVDYQSISSSKVERNTKKGTNSKSANKKLDVVHQKNALQKIIQQELGIIETEKKFNWLKTPPHNDIPSEYEKIIKNLLNYRGSNKIFKPNYSLLCDFYIDKFKLIIEYDERQHFSEARKISLESYPEDIQTFFSIEDWINTCEKINARDNKPINRDETRAFYDSVRDIETYRNEYKLLRIKHGEHNWELEDAAHTLNELLKPILDNRISEVSENISVGRIILNLGANPFELESFENKWVAHKSIIVNNFLNDPDKYLNRIKKLSVALLDSKVDVALFPACTLIYNKKQSLDVYQKILERIPYVVSGILNIKDSDQNYDVSSFEEGIVIMNYGKIVESFDSSIVMHTQLGKISTMSAISSTITNIHKHLLKTNRKSFIKESVNLPPISNSFIIALDSGHHQYSGRYKLSLQAIQRRLNKIATDSMVILSYWKYKNSNPRYIWAEFDRANCSVERKRIQKDILDRFTQIKI